MTIIEIKGTVPFSGLPIVFPGEFGQAPTFETEMTMLAILHSDGFIEPDCRAVFLDDELETRPVASNDDIRDRRHELAPDALAPCRLGHAESTSLLQLEESSFRFVRHSVR